MKTWVQMRFSQSEQVALLKDLSQLLKYGDSPKVIIKDFKQYGTPTEKKIAQDIETSIKNGGRFSDGLKNWIPAIPVQAMRVGEDAGNLAKGCLLAYEGLQATVNATQSFKSAMITPIMLIVVVLILATLITTKGYPELAAISEPAKWPSFTKSAQAFGEHITFFLPLYLFLVVTIPILLRFLCHNWVNRKSVDHLPPFKQFSMITATQILLSLSQLLKANVGIDEAVKIVSKTSTPYGRGHLKKVAENIRKAQGRGNVGAYFDTGLLNSRVQTRLSRMNADGLKTYNLLQRAAEEHGLMYKESTIRATLFMGLFARAIGLGIFLFLIGGIFVLVIDFTTTAL